MCRTTPSHSTLRALVAAAAVLALLPLSSGTALASTGQQVYESMCQACHTIGRGRLIGPDLRGMSERRSEEWLFEFIRGSQAMVAAGDPEAVAIFEEYGTVMPDWPLTDEQLQAVIAYSDVAEAGPPLFELPELTPEHVATGGALFEGSQRLSAGGPPCNSCHDVASDAVIAGGVLAASLTDVVQRLNGAGRVGAIIQSRPFPVMQRAYEGRDLTDDEIIALVAFLEDTQARSAQMQPRDYGIGLFVSGVVGTIFLLGLYSLLWGGRKRESVNQAIFDRQVKSI